MPVPPNNISTGRHHTGLHTYQLLDGVVEVGEVGAVAVPPHLLQFLHQLLCQILVPLECLTFNAKVIVFDVQISEPRVGGFSSPIKWNIY